MPSAITNERQKSNGGTNGHKTNGHGANGASTQPRDEQQHYALLVSQESLLSGSMRMESDAKA
jgi:hypothetical protein